MPEIVLNISQLDFPDDENITVTNLVKHFIQDACVYQNAKKGFSSLTSKDLPSHVQQQHPVIFSQKNLSIFALLDQFTETLKNFDRAKYYLSKLEISEELSSDAVKIFTKILDTITLDEWRERALELARDPLFSERNIHKLLEEQANDLRNFSSNNISEDVESFNSSIIKKALLLSLIAYSCVTKRIIESYIERIVDPIGLVQPVIIRARLFFQKVCAKCNEWNDSIPFEMYPKWVLFQSDLKNLSVFKFSMVEITNKKNIELHGFFKVFSSEAYGICVYLRSSIEGDKRIRLFRAKFRIIPQNSTKFSKFYVAQLLSELMLECKTDANVETCNCYYWSEYTDVVAQIKRLSNINITENDKEIIEKILNISRPEAWRGINPIDNPANLVSGGASAKSLETNSLWWSGPAWLALNAQEWPVLNEE